MNALGARHGLSSLLLTALLDPRARAGELHTEFVAPPASTPSRLPNLWADANGRLGLCWVEVAVEGPAALKLSRLGADGWSEPVVVARGPGWFVNWADFPSVIALDGEHMLAHFLEKTAAGPFDYRVQVVRSADGGRSWTAPVRLHADAGAGEHGFVSLVPLGSRTAGAVWLDGRSVGGHGDAGERGAMSLYTRTLDAGGSLGEELLVDERVCDCCQTAAARAPDGALVIAYRDRSADEVRDISVVRVEDGRIRGAPWSSRDGWQIRGCPVNGPALDVAGGRIGLAWFTLGASGRSRVLCGFSTDGGRTFSAPLELSGDQALGRIDAVFDAEGRLVVSWLESGEPDAAWRVARVASDAGVLDQHTIVRTRAGRESGFGRLERDRESVVFAWTETAEPRVALCRLRWE